MSQTKITIPSPLRTKLSKPFIKDAPKKTYTYNRNLRLLSDSEISILDLGPSLTNQITDGETEREREKGKGKWSIRVEPSSMSRHASWEKRGNADGSQTTSEDEVDYGEVIAVPTPALVPLVTSGAYANRSRVTLRGLTM